MGWSCSGRLGGTHHRHQPRFDVLEMTAKSELCRLFFIEVGKRPSRRAKRTALWLGVSGTRQLRGTSIQPMWKFASFSDAGPAAQTACFPLPTRSSDMNFRSRRFQSHAGDQDGVATAASSKTPSSASSRYLCPSPILAWPRTGTSTGCQPPWRWSELPVPGPGPRSLVPRTLRPPGVSTPSLQALACPTLKSGRPTPSSWHVMPPLTLKS